MVNRLGAALSADTTGAAATGYARSYGYDPAGRLTQVTDQTAAPGTGGVAADGTIGGTPSTACTIRTYAFDANGNRTDKTVIPPNTDGTCQTGSNPTGATTTSWSHNSADRITNTGYAYDDLGRITTIPQSDTPAAQPGGTPGDLTLSYYDSDQIHTQPQSGTTLANGLDATGRPLTQATGPTGGAATSTMTLGYDNGSDSPTSESTTSSSTTTSEAYITGPDGLLAATLTSNGTTQLAANNPHGDTVSQITLPTSTDAAGLDDWTDTDEYGNPTNETTGTTGITATNPTGDATGGLGYGWTGAHQRATQPTGLVQMGARAYNPSTGTFTSVDPVFGGNSTAYAYPLDPVDGADLSGACWWCDVATHVVHFVVGRAGSMIGDYANGVKTAENDLVKWHAKSYRNYQVRRFWRWATRRPQINPERPWEEPFDFYE